MPKWIAFANQKGGVGKTTAVANLGPTLAERGERVLLVDLDPQANLTESFGATGHDGPRIEDLLLGTGNADEALVSVGPGVDLITTSDRLADAAHALAGRVGYETCLARALDPVAARYDYILVDTPPGIGFWSGLALLSVGWVIVPISPADLEVMSAAKVYDFVEHEVRRANPDIRILGVLVNQAQSRFRLWRDTHRALERDGMDPLPVEIPRSVRVASAVRTGRPIVMLEPDGSVAFAYRRLAEHVVATTSTTRAAA